MKNPAETVLILQQFNSVTPENDMKMGPIHPEENRYNWGPADAIVDFAQANHLRVHGHNLCWHEQTPKWLFKNADGNQVRKKLLLKRLHGHVDTLVKRCKGKICAWDVVNEAIAADPKAMLFYNDYNTERPEKMERIYKLPKKLKDAN